MNKALKSELVDRYVFFMDDCGTLASCKGDSNEDSILNKLCFALGGVIVPKEKVKDISNNIKYFKKKWDIPNLHGNKIRNKKGKFNFLNDKKKADDFFSVLDEIIINSKATVHACVICRPGYRDRYSKKFSDASRWDMSKTAFDISVERATKFALNSGRILDLVYEKSGKKEDKKIVGYFKDLKEKGTNFSVKNSNKYKPLVEINYDNYLGNIWSDGKRNELLNLADLVLHPVVSSTMGKDNRAYNTFVENKMLIDYKSEDNNVAVKYSCFDKKYYKKYKA